MDTRMPIHLKWEGPLEIEEVCNLKDDEEDFGIYQVYGNHPIYGSGVLIYIGMTADQSFGERIKQETWLTDDDIKPISIYVGRFDMNDKLSSQQWIELTKMVEKLLIYSHSPAFNSSNINKSLGKEFENMLILNWGTRGNLLPEVSGDRWTDKHPD